MRGRGFWSAAAACLAVAAALVSGCGSSSSDSSSAADTTAAATTETTGSDTASSGPLTKKEFVKQAAQICEDGLAVKEENINAALKNLPAGAAPTKKSAGKVVMLTVLPVYNEIIEQLDELSPPPSDEATVQLIVQKYEAAVEATEANPTLAIDENPFEAGDKAAEAYGISGCIL
jgi:hypothetical protein